MFKNFGTVISGVYHFQLVCSKNMESYCKYPRRERECEHQCENVFGASKVDLSFIQYLYQGADIVYDCSLQGFNIGVVESNGKYYFKFFNFFTSFGLNVFLL